MHRICLPLATALVLLAGCGDKPLVPAPQPPEVTIQVITPEALPLPKTFVGKSVANRTVEIRARVSGTLLERPFTSGGLVKEGDVLFRIDPREFQASLDVTKARLAQAEAQLAKADREVKRIEPLAAQGAASQFDLDARKTELLQAQADVALQEANVRTAELNLSYATITAPFAGKISKASRDPGALIGPSDGVLTTLDVVDPITVEFTISEREILAYRKQLADGVITAPKLTYFEAGATLITGEPYPQTGKISFADVRIRPETGTATLQAEFPNPDGKLVPGQFIRVTLQGVVRPAAILVPQGAVQQSPTGAAVFVLDAEGKAEARPVQLGLWFADRWLIEDGLKTGDRVIVDGVQKVRPGKPVTVIPAAAPTAGK
jgi:membrane fusion protein, multidrug efflux system